MNIWIFCFPGKTEHFYWLRTKELCWEASAVSFKFFFIFLSISSSFSWLFSAAPQQLQKPRENSNVLNTNGASFDQVTRKFGPLYFNSNYMYWNVTVPAKLCCIAMLFLLHFRGGARSVNGWYQLNLYDGLCNCLPYVLSHSSLEFEITLKSISTYKSYTIFFLMTSALIWVHLLNDWKGRFGGLTPTGLAPPPIFGRKIVQFLHSQYLGQSQQKEKNIVLWWVSWRECFALCTLDEKVQF